MSATLPKKPARIRRVFLDHASATPLDASVFSEMKPHLQKKFANPSALYREAVEARDAVEEARKTVAQIFDAQPDSILFTASGSESANLAIVGAVRAFARASKSRPHLVTTDIEHHAVLRPMERLARESADVTIVPGGTDGVVSADEIRDALLENTVLVSVMYANNELGTIFPIADIGRIILAWRKKNRSSYPLFHVDACAAAAYLPLAASKLHADIISISASKFYGPKGVGALYRRRGVALEPLMEGGGQEFGLRPGTEHVAGIVGLARAIALTQKHREKTNQKIKALRNYLWQRIASEIPDVVRNPSTSMGKEEIFLSNALNVTFRDADAEALILYLDAYGIQCSSGSACATNADETSHVLSAIGLSTVDARSTLRFTLGNETTKGDIEYVMRYLPRMVGAVRAMNVSQI